MHIPRTAGKREVAWSLSRSSFTAEIHAADCTVEASRPIVLDAHLRDLRKAHHSLKYHPLRQAKSSGADCKTDPTPSAHIPLPLCLGATTDFDGIRRLHGAGSCSLIPVHPRRRAFTSSAQGSAQDTEGIARTLPQRDTRQLRTQALTHTRPRRPAFTCKQRSSRQAESGGYGACTQRRRKARLKML